MLREEGVKVNYTSNQIDPVGQANISELAQQVAENASSTSEGKIVTTATVVSSKDTPISSDASQQSDGSQRNTTQASQDGNQDEALIT